MAPWRLHTTRVQSDGRHHEDHRHDGCHCRRVGEASGSTRSRGTERRRRRRITHYAQRAVPFMTESRTKLSTSKASPSRPAPAGTGPSARTRRVLAPRLREPQPELAWRLVVVHVVVWVARPRERRWVGRQAEVREDVPDRLALCDDSEHTKPALTLRALEDVDVERPSEQARPVDPRRRRVERTTEQPIPVAHGEDVRRERDHVTN